MNQYLEIPFRLPSLNEVIGANRKNPYAGAKLKRDTEEQLMWLIKSAKLMPVTQPCIVHMLFIEPNRRRDADNVESAKKFILDALVKSGVLLNDNPRWVVGAPSFTRYGEGACVRVTIIEDAREDYLRQKLRAASETITEVNGDVPQGTA